MPQLAHVTCRSNHSQLDRHTCAIFVKSSASISPTLAKAQAVFTRSCHAAFASTHVCVCVNARQGAGKSG